jgi:uncharacterized RDD family membrane protein YckC
VAVARYLDRKGDGSRRREILTPEGIPIQFTLASIGERTTALALDILIVGAVVFLVALIAALASGGEHDWIGALVLLLVTLTRHFYFAFFELRGHGATIGKRIARVRVIDARGGSLEASAVLARNLIRELELWMPLTFLIAMPVVWPDAPAWVWVVMTAWLVVLALFPVFNKDNLRVGDLVGGTIVVAEPRVQLRADLSDARASAAKQLNSVMQQQVTIAAKGPTYTFTEAQLEVYGIYELQVLEGLLRGEAASDATAVSAVAEKIRAKIQFAETVPPGKDEAFLADFYTALRAHLEKRLLFGKRREDKFDKRA